MIWLYYRVPHYTYQIPGMYSGGVIVGGVALKVVEMVMVATDREKGVSCNITQ